MTSSEDEKEGKKSFLSETWSSLWAAASVPVVLSLTLGYNVGYYRGVHSNSDRDGRYMIMSFVTVGFFRELWHVVPVWVKRQIPVLGRSYRKKDTLEIDPNDMSSIATISAKLDTIGSLLEERVGATLSDTKTRIALAMVLKMMAYVHKHMPQAHDELEFDSFDDPTVLKEMDECFEWADAAYDEINGGKSLKEFLGDEGFRLVRHEKEVLPGSVSHYVAICKERKMALIGVRGTSGFEEMLTDLCGSSECHELDGTFSEGGPTKIWCHDGILAASRRLADDLDHLVEELFIPNDYQILLTGHSLGAGAAALAGFILRSRFPELQEKRSDGILPLRVIAFASPPVLDPEAALACKEFCTTIVNNSDVIPRASVDSLMSLTLILKRVYEKVEAKGLAPDDLTKTFDFLMNLLLKSIPEEDTLEGDYDKTNDIMLLSINELWEIVSNTTNEVFEIDDKSHHLIVPGTVIYMFDLWSEPCFDPDAKAVNSGRVKVVDGTMRPLRVVDLNSRMLMDHMSPAYRSRIKALLASIKPDE